MTTGALLFFVLLVALGVLSLRTLSVLKRSAPWSSAGWWATYGYCVAEGLEIARRTPLPAHLPYWFLAALVVAFVVAGFRDEPQAEPSWWPQRLGPSRRERSGIR